MKKNSELTIGQVLRQFYNFNPIKIYINKILVWDEDDNTINFFLLAS